MPCPTPSIRPIPDVPLDRLPQRIFLHPYQQWRAPNAKVQDSKTQLLLLKELLAEKIQESSSARSVRSSEAHRIRLMPTRATHLRSTRNFHSRRKYAAWNCPRQISRSNIDWPATRWTEIFWLEEERFCWKCGLSCWLPQHVVRVCNAVFSCVCIRWSQSP